jgi:hypothetical protein
VPNFDLQYDLWRAIAGEFGVPYAEGMQPGVSNSKKMEKLILHHSGVPGVAVMYQPFEQDPAAPPVLTFAPDGLTYEMSVGVSAIHYEWVFCSIKGRLDVGLHFQFDDPAMNKRCVNKYWMNKAQRPPVFRDPNLSNDVPCTRWTVPANNESPLLIPGWVLLRYRLPCEADKVILDPTRIASQAAHAMELLMMHTWGYLKIGNARR